MNIELLNSETIMSDEVFDEVFEHEDEIVREKLFIALSNKAKQLGVKSQFDGLVRVYKSVHKALMKQQPLALVDKWTNFDDTYPRMRCKNWIASEQGVMQEVFNTGSNTMTNQLACYHPILPIERMKNMQTGEEQIKIAFKRSGRWEEIIVPKDLVASASKIVALSKRGVSVTSENAKFLVKYLADVENENDDYIPVQYSTSKLGWHGADFVPYDKTIIFDGDARFKSIADSLVRQGDREAWYRHARELRQTKRMEIMMLMAASFSSVIIKQIGALPYFVDFWGMTEGGKTVALMTACSIWADPSESAYIGDFKTTDVALEARADLLNHLPMILDDTSKKDKRIEDNFEAVVYNLCSGKGKSRSNKELGINRENKWSNAMLTNGERPLRSYTQQGGAINRIIEVKCGKNIFENPAQTADIVKKNYGFAGEDFVGVIKDLGSAKVKEIYKGFMALLKDDAKMQKQSMSLACVLTADKIATDYLFKDDIYIDIDAAKSLLTDYSEVSDTERCYQYIQGEIIINQDRFADDLPGEKWGRVKDGYVSLFPNVLDRICAKGKFSAEAFLSWAYESGILDTNKGRKTKIVKFGTKSVRCYVIKLEDADVDENGFMSVIDGDEEIPFA